MSHSPAVEQLVDAIKTDPEARDAIIEALRDHGDVYTRRQVMAAATATGAVGVLSALGIDSAEASHGTGEMGEQGDPLDKVWTTSIGGDGDTVSFDDPVDVDEVDINGYDRVGIPSNPALGFRANADRDDGILGETTTTVAGNDGQYAKYGAVYPDGDVMGWFAFDAADEELSLYLIDESSAGGGGDLAKRLDVKTSNNSVNWIETNVHTVRAEEGSQAIQQLRVNGSSESDTFYEGFDHTGTRTWRIGRDVSLGGIVIYDDINDIIAGRWRQDIEEWDWNAVLQTNFGNVYSNASAGDLATDEIALDTNRGGTGNTAFLREQGGSVYYWDADGTL